MDQQQFGVSLGGPSRRRTFYFANVEQRLLDQTGVVTIRRRTSRPSTRRLAAVGYPGPPVTTGIYPNPVHSATCSARSITSSAARDQFSVRYASTT